MLSIVESIAPALIQIMSVQRGCERFRGNITMRPSNDYQLAHHAGNEGLKEPGKKQSRRAGMQRLQWI